ncbi:MAG: hydantoinase B/oxoprolinase family protein [Thaumarchaeota archaeon]|nr:hydantoinase B/oxoprolinase family protein [Nitrososphaerota archaeon]
MSEDRIQVEVTKHSLVYISEEMAVLLRKSAFSPNIRERADHSCALLDAQGRTIGQAEQIPVHIGSLPLGLKNTLRYLEEHGVPQKKGDTYVVNDPYISGTHLNDVTLIGPVFRDSQIVGYVANKAHHVDVGGMVPGSISPDATELYQEGLIIAPVKLIDGGKLNKEVLALMKSDSRQPDFIEGDLRAQIAANRLGERRFLELVTKVGASRFPSVAESIMDHTEELTRHEFGKMPRGTWSGEDFLELGGGLLSIKASVSFTRNGVRVNFDGTARQVEAPLNAVLGVTIAAVSFAVKSLISSNVQLNDGFNRMINVVARPGLLVNPERPMPVAAGNLETSQRIVDVIFRALASALPDRVPAASHGSMNNLMMGGILPNTGESWAFYETIGGGSGARPNSDGVDGVQVNMTNTMNTPIEVMEHYYPLIFSEYSLRDGTGGQGRWRGGLGIRRSFTTKARVRVTILGERARIRPWGLNGGKEGENSSYRLKRADGKTLRLPSKCTTALEAGDSILIETAGGGGFGLRGLRNENARKRDGDYGYK